MLLLQALVDAGVIPGADMTPEAALMKLGYVLTKDMDVERKRKVTPQIYATSSIIKCRFNYSEIN